MSPHPFSNNKPAAHPTRILFTHSKDPRENSSRACYILHGVLVMIHVVLVIFSVYHWEHRVVFPFTSTNNDFWPVVLSASLQAFYTIYTAVLLFLTQQLAISETLVRRLKLTSIHDISGAWSGLGSALRSIWQQIDIPASWWTTSAVAAYLACISVLHVTSSTILQFQTFNTTTSTSVPTTLGWRDDMSDWSLNWGVITASLPVINQLPGLATPGLSNTTIYDTPQTGPMMGNATVNATTITSRCGLLPNVSYFQVNGTPWNYNIPMSMAQLPSTAAIPIPVTATPPWSDQIQVLQIPGAGTAYDFSSLMDEYQQPGVLLMVSTLLDIDPSIQEEVTVPMTWVDYYAPPSSEWVKSVIKVYFVQCSLLATTRETLLDMQTNKLWNPVFIPESQPSMQWALYQQIPNHWQGQIGQGLGTPVSSGYDFYDGPLGFVSKPSIADEHIMKLAGLNLATQYSQWAAQAPPVSNATLTPDRLEAVMAQVAAQLIWTAAQIGKSNGGFDLGNGMANVDEQIISLRLNVNQLPLLFASSASVIMLGLALHMTRAFGASHHSQAAIPNNGALQLLWLGHHSASVHSALEDVEHPTDANLRRAGMIDVCFARTVSDEEYQLSMRSSTDSLSGSCDDNLG